MIGCAKGLLTCEITKNEQLQIVRPEVEYSNRYIVDVENCGDNKFIVVCTRPYFLKASKIPPGETNFPIVTYTLFHPLEQDPDQKILLLGQFRSTEEQATFPVCKVNVLSKKLKMTSQQQSYVDSEAQYAGRFYLTMVDKHLKMIDIQRFQMVDLLTEPNYDDESLHGIGLVRRSIDKVFHMLILCKNEEGNYIQKVDFNSILPKSLEIKVEKFFAKPVPQKNEMNEEF